MAAADGPERLRVSYRSVALFVGLIGLTLLVLRMVSAASRVIGWMLVAAAVAGLLHPLIRRLEARGWKRGRAVLVVAFGALLLAALTTYRVVDDVSQATKLLQQEAPEAAAELERNERFGEFATTVKLEERTRDFTAKVPEYLRGGTPAEALRAATTRGVAFLTTSVLTLFLLLHGPKIAVAGLRQIADERRRARVTAVAKAAYRRAFGYASGSLATALLAAWVAYAAAMAFDVPGAAALAVWVGLWDVVPIIGAFTGALPIVLLAAVREPWHGAVLAVIFLAYQLFEDFGIQPRLESRTMRLGPFLTVAAGFAGLEVRGLAGALIAVLAVATVVAALDEVTPEDQPR
ncbi:MAG TPA: AI-2E family transporter [Frankiaceae bacterium]|nr:AI-2E family transporter [Frankiaceae bacterium]